jgi:hypothetical protein
MSREQSHEGSRPGSREGSRPGSREGSRPGSAECRAYLRGALGGWDGRSSGAHPDSCSFCAARMAARDRLAPLLARRPRLPLELSTVVTVDEVFARIVEQSSESKLGSMLERGMPSSPPKGEEAGWPEPLLESRVGRLTAVAQSVNSPAVWAQVRRSILASVTSGIPRHAHRWWMLGLASAAVVAIACTVLLADSQDPPSIVFADLDQAPRVEFAVLRQGALR